MTALHCY